MLPGGSPRCFAFSAAVALWLVWCAAGAAGEQPGVIPANAVATPPGQAVVWLEDVGEVRFVFGKIVIDEPPDRVWRVLANPYEFEGKIFPRMKQVEVVVDSPEVSVLKCTVEVCFPLPGLTYLVESRYEPFGRVEFRRLGGTLKDFRGFWSISPVDGGARSAVTYCLYVDPGFPVPQWVVRQGVKVELPRTLRSLKRRIDAVYGGRAPLEPRSISAASSRRADSPEAAPVAAGASPYTVP